MRSRPRQITGNVSKTKNSFFLSSGLHSVKSFINMGKDKNYTLMEIVTGFD